MNTDEMFKKVIKQAAEYECTHRRIYLPKRKQAIQKLIDRFKTEFSGEVHIKENWSHDSVVIQLVAKKIASCDEAPTFRYMIAASNACIIKGRFGKVHYHLVYSFWEWQKIGPQ